MGDFQGEAWGQRANTQVTYGHCFSVTEWADALTQERNVLTSSQDPGRPVFGSLHRHSSSDDHEPVSSSLQDSISARTPSNGNRT